MSTVFGNSSANTYLTRTTNLPSITSFSVGLWIYPTAFTSFRRIVCVGNTSGTWYSLSLFTSGELTAESPAGNNNSSALTLNAWTHIAMTVSGTTGTNMFVYRNGVLDFSNGVGSVTANVIYIGSGGPAFASPFVGRMQGLKIYGAVLTAADWLQEIRQTAPERTANLNDFRPFLASGDVGDYSGNGNAATTTGTLTTTDGAPIPWRGRKRRPVYVPSTGGSTVYGNVFKSPVFNSPVIRSVGHAY